MIRIEPISAFTDNYIWLLSRPDSPYAVLVDPGDAAPALARLAKRALTPIALLITHHHWDHTHGIAELLDHYPMPVYGPARESIAGLTHPLAEGDTVRLAPLDLELRVLDVPGHTRGAISYYGDGCLFCGDTLFTAGCGRLFEGTAAQMHGSLAKLAALPDATQVYCGHEYTLDNLRFAQVVEPHSAALRQRLADTQALRRQGLPSVPAPLGLEKLTNPFLRYADAGVMEAAADWAGRSLNDATEVFATLRRWKDSLDDQE